MKENLESEPESPQNGKDNNVKHNQTNKNTQEEQGIGKRIKAFFAFFTVEPFLLCYILPNVISALAVQQLNLMKACRADLNYTEEVCANFLAGVDDNITNQASLESQILVAGMTSWKEPLQSGIPAIVILFVGAWSDKTGNRKPLMLIPLCGEIISAALLLLATYYFLEWPLWVTGLIEALPSAFTGGRSIALMGAYSFIADVTTTESRTFRVGMVAVIVTLGIPLGTSISGVLLTAVGYYGVFSIGLAIFILGFIHTCFRVHDVNVTKQKGTFKQKVIQFFHPKNAWDTISLVFISRGQQRIKIILVICAHIVIVGPVFGEGPLLYLYVLYKYSMSVETFSLFLTCSVLIGVAGTMVAVSVFSKLLKMHDAFIGIIATACKVASSFVYGLAPTAEWFYSGPIFDFFGNTGVTAIRSLGTKIVDVEQVGKMCSLIGFVEAVVPVIYTPIYSSIYAQTLETFIGTFYIVGGVMTIPAFFIFINLYMLHKKEERDVVKDPAAKETHAYDNCVTAL